MTLKTNTLRLLSNPKIALFFLFFFAPFMLLAQTVEDCNNGIDDDGDGLIDCFDPDCTCTGQCDDFYYTTCNPDCYFVPPCGPISLAVQWVSNAETGTYSPLVAGDLDGDGIPEVVTTRVEAADLYIIDGATGLTKVHIVNPNTVWPGGTAPAIADLDNDGFGEIVIVGFNRRMYCYEHTGALKWVSNPVGYNARYRYAVPNIADFDHNGWPEVNVGNQVYSGQTGALLASGGSFFSAGEHPARVAGGFSFASPVAMDVLPDNFCGSCTGLEIVAGNQVLSVNLTTGLVLPVVVAPAPFTDGFTSVADFDGDGDLDAIVQGRRGGQNTVYVWDIQTPTILREYPLLNNWVEGASRVNVADLDGDGQLEVSFVSHPWLYALQNDFTPLWINSIYDASSITCSSVFDFCGDGSAELIYRSESRLQVLDGATGGVIWEDDCLSLTHIENPLVLDVDGDGQTEIVIQCGSNGSSVTGTVVAYRAIGTPNISSRKVWNQHGYFNTNINEDLSVPRYQQNPHIVGDSLRLNTFMNQFYNPTFPSPDGTVSVQDLICDRDSLELILEICNVGDNIFPQQTPISFYVGNPQTSAAQWLSTQSTAQNIALGACQTITVRIPRAANDSIFIVLNDNASLPPPFNLGLDFPVTAIGECGFDNNIAAFYFPYQPDVVNLGQDTAICANTTLPLDANGNDLSTWQWTSGADTPLFTVQNPGTYSVTVTDVCAITQVASIVVGIDSSTIVDIGQDLAICQGETLSLSENGFDFYAWTSSASLSCTNCNSVEITPLSSAFVVLEAGFANGCSNRDSVFITVNQTYDYTIDTTICFGRTLDWAGQTLAPGESFLFDLQTLNGCDSTVLVRVFGTALGTYNFTVDTAVCQGATITINNVVLAPEEEMTFNLSSVLGCDSTVHVRVIPLDTIYLIESRAICFGETTEIFGVQQGIAGEYTGRFTGSNGCDSVHVIGLSVFPQIQLVVDGTPACFGESNAAISLSVTNGFDPLQYVWDISGQHSPQLTDLPPGTYSVTVTDANDCSAARAIQVGEHPQSVFSAQADSVSCFGLQDGSISIITPDPGLLFQLDDGPFVQNNLYENLGVGTYSLVSQDVFGCNDTLQILVQEPPQASISLPADTTILLGVSVPLLIELNGINPVQWTWSDTSFLSCLSCPAPIVQSPQRTIRYVLTVIDQNGCSAMDDMLLVVEEFVGIYVPNVMGGSSGDNTALRLGFSSTVARVNLFQVYDRWGEMLHEARNVLPDDDALTWDGRFRGKLVNPGVYLWQMELELSDGTVLKKVGDVTVVR